MKLKRTDTLEITERRLFVNGRPFNVTHPYEPVLGMENRNLVTIVFRGGGRFLTEGELEEIEGEFF